MPTRLTNEPAARTPYDRRSTYVAGSILIGLGLIFLATTTGLMAWATITNLWPLCLTVPGAFLLLRAERSTMTGGIVLLGLGGLFLALTTGLLAWSRLANRWPLVLIIPGVALVLGRGR